LVHVGRSSHGEFTGTGTTVVEWQGRKWESTRSTAWGSREHVTSGDREPLKSEMPQPAPATVKSLSSLELIEGAMDVIVCAWVGIGYIRKKAKPYGDHAGAIRVPDPRE